MTLSELASFVCRTVSETEASDVAACKAYLTQRSEMLWLDQLWRESLVEYEQTITSVGYDATSSPWLPTRQILLLAPIIANVVAIRTRDHKMGPQSSEYYYCVDKNVFDNQGSATEYRLLSPAVWDFDTAQSLDGWCTDSADAASVLRVGTLGSDGLTETTTELSVATAGQSLGTVLTVQSASKAASTGTVQIGQAVANTFAFLVTYFGAQTLKIAFNSSDMNNAVASGSGTFVFTSIDVSPGAVVHMWLDGVATPNTYTVGQAGTLAVDNAGTFVFTPQDDAAQTAIVTLQAAETVAAKRQRVQIIGGVADGTVLRVLGKRHPPSFEADSDTAPIVGSDNCLIAFALSDMYRKSRQLGKAQATAQEGAALLAQLVKLRTGQEAFKKRFIPQDGFGGVNSFQPGGSGGFHF